MEKEPSHTENEFQSNYNAEDSSSGAKASKLLALYEMVRCYVVNFVGGMYKKLESSDNKNTFYLRIFTMLGTFLLYVFDYLSLRVLSSIMFFDVLIKSFRHLSSVHDKYNNNMLVNQWTTYGCVALLVTIFDFITSMTTFPPIKLFINFCKLFLCYKLATNETTSSTVLNTSLKFYSVNKRGLDGLHDVGVTAVSHVKSMYV
jgi:hypothetical protein